ncbi:MAG: hypothetical protein ACK5ZH_05600 [Alphaproteobacteria bacterium]|jgi:hypothetical protein
MFQINLILFLLALLVWKFFFSKYKITLVSPIFRNTQTKELGGWAKLTMRIPFPPFPGLILHDRKGGIYTIRNVKWDKGDRTITCDTYHAQPICVDDNGQYEHIKRHVIEFGWKFREVPEGHILNWWKEEYEK